MISKRAKKIAKGIDAKVKKRRDEYNKKQNLISPKVHFAHEYKICPICANKLSHPFFANVFTSAYTISSTWKCKKCKKCKILYIVKGINSMRCHCTLKKLK